MDKFSLFFNRNILHLELCKKKKKNCLEYFGKEIIQNFFTDISRTFRLITFCSFKTTLGEDQRVLRGEEALILEDSV